ncbi:sigma-70 family RNA polymerase sigma factor [Clostridium botulinum]|nr:sigma-70 family RNA polymerase sigma factor [Clostridium botulinum]NFO31467.1 sigma-70 family RNA polymerase sigma factor [Clostridium botulinum]NFO54825.1 sigma-70 family RNA polymerase sigma factor [Clostridium botulinum]
MKKVIDVTEHLGLAYSEARKIYKVLKSKYELDDLIQVASVGLVKAGMNYDKDKGYTFSTFATACIRGFLYNFIRRDKKYNLKQGVPHNFSIISYEYEYVTGSLDEKIGANEFEDELIKKIDIKSVIEKLDEKEKQIIELYYFKNNKQAQVAKLLGISQIQVSRRLKKIIEKVRKATKDPTKVSEVAMRKITVPLYHTLEV